MHWGVGVHLMYNAARGFSFMHQVRSWCAAGPTWWSRTTATSAGSPPWSSRLSVNTTTRWAIDKRSTLYTEQHLFLHWTIMVQSRRSLVTWSLVLGSTMLASLTSDRWIENLQKTFCFFVLYYLSASTQNIDTMDLEDYTGSTLWDLSETRVFRSATKNIDVAL